MEHETYNSREQAQIDLLTDRLQNSTNENNVLKARIVELESTIVRMAIKASK